MYKSIFLYFVFRGWGRGPVFTTYFWSGVSSVADEREAAALILRIEFMGFCHPVYTSVVRAKRSCKTHFLPKILARYWGS
jgi:hypothetical protein